MIIELLADATRRDGVAAILAHMIEAVRRFVRAHPMRWLYEEGQRHRELTGAYSARRLASFLEGVMLRICVEWGAGFPDRRPLASTMAEGYELFLRAARPQDGDRRATRRATRASKRD